jgi:hypothetical protein
MFNFREIPVPRIDSGHAYEKIAKLTAQLIATTKEFEELKKEIGITHAVIGENDRLMTLAKLDVEVARLYGFSKEDMRHILKAFPLVHEKYKELVLQMFD